MGRDWRSFRDVGAKPGACGRSAGSLREDAPSKLGPEVMSWFLMAVRSGVSRMDAARFAGIGGWIVCSAEDAADCCTGAHPSRAEHEWRR